ncbi:MAG TPA: hypothetical protein VLZ89_05590 [Anaerolineales bacterium]|nr:hypothetical protein [Anaerolineales bacterium]
MTDYRKCLGGAVMWFRARQDLLGFSQNAIIRSDLNVSALDQIEYFRGGPFGLSRPRTRAVVSNTTALNIRVSLLCGSS